MMKLNKTEQEKLGTWHCNAGRSLDDNCFVKQHCVNTPLGRCCLCLMASHGEWVSRVDLHEFSWIYSSWSSWSHILQSGWWRERERERDVLNYLLNGPLSEFQETRECWKVSSMCEGNETGRILPGMYWVRTPSLRWLCFLLPNCRWKWGKSNFSMELFNSKI